MFFGIALVGAISALVGVASAFDPYCTKTKHAAHAVGYGLLLALLFSAALSLPAGIACGLVFAICYAGGATEVTHYLKRLPR